jgi:hypothetical protein
VPNTLSGVREAAVAAGTQPIRRIMHTSRQRIFFMSVSSVNHNQAFTYEEKYTTSKKYSQLFIVLMHLFEGMDCRKRGYDAGYYQEY